MSEQARERTVCPNCGGTGDLATFHGKSRFVLTHEECPFCSGFGYVEAAGRPEDPAAEKKGGAAPA